MRVLVTALVLVAVVSCKARNGGGSKVLEQQIVSADNLGEFDTEINRISQDNLLDFDLLKVRDWEGDGSSGVLPSYVRTLNPTEPAEIEKLQVEVDALKASYEQFGMAANFEKSWLLFHTNAAPPGQPANWVGDHMFTKAVKANGEHVRVNPYFRVVGYANHTEGKQASAAELKKVMKAGDIIVFWHPEMNDYGLMGEAGQKESVKLRSTHAGMAWFDGEKIWALNSPHGYHAGWFDNSFHYPFHIFRVVPNPSSKAGMGSSGSPGSNFNYDFAKPGVRDALSSLHSLYAAKMANYFRFPGDYNGGDPLELFSPELIRGFHERVLLDKDLPAISSLVQTGGKYSVKPLAAGEGEGGAEQAQIYCAEYVWTSTTMALNNILPENPGPFDYWKRNFKAIQYKAEDDSKSLPNWTMIAGLRETLRSGLKRRVPSGSELPGWTKDPAFVFEPYTLWDLVESFLWTYYKENYNLPVGQRLLPHAFRAQVLRAMKPNIMANMGAPAAEIPNNASLIGTYGEVLADASITKFAAAVGVAGAGDKGKTLNYIFDAIIATLLMSEEKPENEAITTSRKNMLKQFSAQLMVKAVTAIAQPVLTTEGKPMAIPMRFLPPHSFILEAQKLDSNIVYVATAVPNDILKANPTRGAVALLQPASAAAVASSPLVQDPPATGAPTAAQSLAVAPVVAESTADRGNREQRNQADLRRQQAQEAAAVPRAERRRTEPK